jgi:asparaginyl-tRNA synthetase
MHQYIVDFSRYEGQAVEVKGWVSNKRESKTNIFIVLRDGTGFAQCVASLEVVGQEQFDLAASLTQETAVWLRGTVVRDDKQMGGYELRIQSLGVYQVATEYPISNKEHGVKFLSDNRHLWLRSRRQWAIMRVRNQVIMGIHEFFQEQGFVQMDAPIFTPNACEGTTDLFETDFFGAPAYLSQSGQLYGEAMAMAQGKIYTFGPTFRAEKSDTPRHLAEFWMIEPEMAFFDNDMNMDMIEAFVKHVVRRVLDRCKVELETLERDTQALEDIFQTFPRVPYMEAIDILNGKKEINGRNAIKLQEDDLQAAKDAIAAAQQKIAEYEAGMNQAGVKAGQRNYYQSQIDKLKGQIRDNEERLRNIPKWIESALAFKYGNDFGNSDETVLTRVFDAPVMVHTWPSHIKSFYMKEVDGNSDFVRNVDLLAPGGYGEIVGGSERETRLDVLVRKIQEHNLPMEYFEWYLDLRRYGSVPHAGFGLGLERMVRWVCGLEHLRETIPFPRRYGRSTP